MHARGGRGVVFGAVADAFLALDVVVVSKQQQFFLSNVMKRLCSGGE